MTEYLITDCLTGRETWTVGDSPRAALIAHENALRSVTKRHHLRPAQLLPPTAKITRATTDRADLIDGQIGDSRILGRAENVRR